MKLYKSIASVIFISAVSLSIISCKKDSSSSTQIVTIGDVQKFGSDSVRSWVKTDVNKNPTSIGVTFKASALSGLSTTDTMCMLMLPSMSGMGMMMASPYDHVEIDWVPMGDPSPSVYNVGHLDCHFFTVDTTYQMGIMGGADMSTLGLQYRPMNCIADGDAEASMGTHWIDTTASEYHGVPFSHSYNYGFYQTKMTFIEALCSKAFLDSKASYTGVIKQPAAFGKSGYYPTSYTISYNASTMEYTYSLDNLKFH